MGRDGVARPDRRWVVICPLCGRERGTSGEYEGPLVCAWTESAECESVRVALGLPPMFTGVAGDEPVLDAVRRLRDDAGRCDVCAKEGVTLAICGECSVADHAKKASGR